MKRDLIITSLGLMFSYPVLANIPVNEIEQLKNQYAAVIQQLKENPPDINKELKNISDDEIKKAAEFPRDITFDFFPAETTAMSLGKS